MGPHPCFPESLASIFRLNLSPQSLASISRPDSHDSFDVARLHSSLVPQSGASSASGRIAGGRRFDTPRCSVALAAGVSVPRDEKLPPGTRLDLVIVQKSADAGGSAIRTRRHRKCSHSLSFRDRVASSLRSTERIFPPRRLQHATFEAGFQPRPARWAPRHKSLCHDDDRTDPAPPLIRPVISIPEINAR
jgi:hypothetical protein